MITRITGLHGYPLWLLNIVLSMFSPQLYFGFHVITIQKEMTNTFITANPVVTRRTRTSVWMGQAKQIATTSSLEMVQVKDLVVTEILTLRSETVGAIN